MKNKKGWAGLIGIIIIFALIVSAIYVVFLIFRSSGSSTDIAYGYEENAFWGKLYLKDDHKTVYCIEKNSNLAQIAESASTLKKNVKVYYNEYFIRGSLCSFTEKYDGVVVTKIDVLS